MRLQAQDNMYTLGTWLLSYMVIW